MNERYIKSTIEEMQVKQSLRPRARVQLLLWDGKSAFTSDHNVTVHGSWADAMTALELLGPRYDDVDYRELDND